MKIELWIEIQGYNEKGKKTKHKRFKSNSFVIGFADWISASFGNATISNVKDTSGTLRTLGAHTMSAIGPDNSSDYGIVVGTDNTAVALGDYKLGNQCLQGTGANKLVHSVVTKDATPTTDGSSRYLRLYRTFTNSSGSDITIQEMGLYVKPSANTYYYLLDRTIQTYTILNEHSAIFTYEWRVTV